MKSNRKTLTALAIAGMLGTGVAQADVLATSIVHLTDFEIQDQSDNSVISLADFSALSYTTNATISASLASDGGLGSTDSDGGASTGGIDTTTGAALPISLIDLAPVCQGDCPAIGDNAFPVVSTNFGDPNNSYAAADQEEQGAPISGIPDAGGGFIPTGAAISGAAYGELITADQGQSTADNTLTGSFEFAVDNDTDIQLVFDVEAYLESYVSTDEPLGADANSAYDISFNISGGGNDFALAAAAGISNLVLGGTIVNGTDLLADTTNRDSLSNGVEFEGDALGNPLNDSFLVTVDFTLVAGTLYSFNFAINNEANVTSVAVPEPSLISILGASMLGLTGFGWLRRRRLG